MECRLRLLGRACTLEVMSYGGRVQCRCWKEGIATVAPFPVVGFEEGWPVSYDDASLSPEECRRRDRELAEWRQKGCLHPGMDGDVRKVDYQHFGDVNVSSSTG
jgi:hypothetical protein